MKNLDKKKMLLLLSIGMGAIILIIAVITIIASVFGNKKTTYENVETKLKYAAVKYFDNNEVKLPTEEGMIVTVDYTMLEQEKYLKPLSKMTSKDVSCTAKVEVTKNGEKYLYSPILNCGDSYKTKKLTDVIIASSVKDGDGLYQTDSGYRFKGEKPNNYVKINGKLWVIIDIDLDGYARVMYADKKMDSYVWDDRYNIEKDDSYGINTYEKSRVRETLLSIFGSTKLLEETDKEYVAYKDFCIGKRSEENNAFSQEVECAEKISGEPLGLPYESDYALASLDSTCTGIYDKQCSNYNYFININNTYWTMTGLLDDTYHVFAIDGSGTDYSQAKNEKTLRPIMYLSNNVLYASGDGSNASPYILK